MHVLVLILDSVVFVTDFSFVWFLKTERYGIRLKYILRAYRTVIEEEIVELHGQRGLTSLSWI